MISSFFYERKFNLDQIPPVYNPEEFKNHNNAFWYLKNHNYETFAFCDDVFSSEELYKIVLLGNLFNEEQAHVGGQTGSLNTEVRSSKVAWIVPNNYTEWIYRRIADVVNQTNDDIFKFDLSKIEIFQFTKYKQEDVGFYGKHIDPFFGLHSPENRKLSVVVQLSDPSEYEGGNLCLYTGKDPTIIEKKKGRIVFFPSYTLHEVTPVTKGTRYTLVGWVHGPAFK